MLGLLMPKRRASASADGLDRGWVSNRVKTVAGPLVDEDLAYTYSAVWSATRLLSESVSMLPLITYEKLDQEDRQAATDHPLYDLLKTKPNPLMGSMVFREGRVAHQVNWGNAFAEIERNPRDEVVALWPIHPSRVRPVNPRDDKPGYSYVVRNNDGSSIALKAEEMLHVPGVLSEDGIWGKGVIAYARESVGFGLGVERHGATYFGTGGQPRGIVKLPGLKDSGARQQFRQEWREMHGHPDSAEIAIIPPEGDYISMSVSNEDAQFLSTRQFNILEICRWYRIPPHMLAELGRATWGNTETMGLEFVIYSLLPWLRRWEEQINLKLLSPEERKQYYVEHQLAMLLRGDQASRYNSYHTALTNGFMTINEIRRLENLNNVGPAGDVLYFPLNMTTVDRMYKGEPPPGTPLPAPALPPAPSGGDGKTPAKPDEEGDLDEEAMATIQRKAAQDILAGTLGRMFTKEARAAQRTIDGKKDFDDWLQTFYAGHEGLLATALTPDLALLHTFSAWGNEPATSLAANLVRESKALLRTAYDESTPVQFREMLTLWPTERAQAKAAEICKGPPAVQVNNQANSQTVNVDVNVNIAKANAGQTGV